MKRRVFFSVMFSVLICFFTLYGLSTAYINIQNTTSRDKITSAAEAFVNKEKGTAEIYVFGKKTGEVKLKKSELPEFLWAAVPPETRFLWIGAKRLEEYFFEGYI
ncbi:MAG: hypothetical protein ACI4KD_07225 [Oscillospiraceae bacterium]